MLKRIGAVAALTLGALSFAGTAHADINVHDNVVKIPVNVIVHDVLQHFVAIVDIA